MYSLLVLLPFFSVFILNLPFRAVMKKAAFWLCVAVLAVQLCLVISSLRCPFSTSRDLFGSFLRFDFSVDTLSRILLFCISVVVFVALCVQTYIIRDEERIFNFVNLLLIILAGMNGVVLVRDIFSLYVFLEIASACSFILIAFNKDIGAFEGAFKYLVMSIVATVLLLVSIALLLVVAGDTSFSALKAALKTSPDRFFINFAVGIFLSACFIKAGLVPFHGWLPDAYSAAPASVSVLLAGIVTKTVGVYAIIRTVGFIFGLAGSLPYVLLAAGALSVVFGALAALGQSDFKRMLAYSSVSQIGYVILGLGCGTALGMAGAVLHLFNHSIFKSLLFVNSAAVELETGTKNMDELSGLATKMPLTGATSVLASLSCAGIPPLAGFWSKLLIIMALWMRGYHAYAVIAVAASVLTLAYLLSMQRRVFFGKLAEGLDSIKEAGFGLALPALLLAAITVGAGLCFPCIINIFIFP